MPRRRSSSLVPSWLRHRKLVLGEAILITGAGQMVVQNWVAGLAIAPAFKVLWAMASTLGMLSLLLWLVRAWVIKGVATTHAVVRAVVIIPTPLLLLHIVAYGLLFLLYAHLMRMPVLG
jgi:hypothetical protein